MMNIIHDYIHEYDFPYHNYLKKYKESLVDIYLTYKNNNPLLTDLQLSNNEEIPTFLLPKIKKIIKKSYWIDKPIIDYGLRIYVQNDKSNTSFYHNHMLASSLSAVFYLDPPREGGELLFLTGFTNNNNNKPKEIIIKPKKDKIYVFPYWLYHRPLPQKDKDYRICFNYLYGSPTRPVSKITSTIW